jgi:hypothetical protein
MFSVTLWALYFSTFKRLICCHISVGRLYSTVYWIKGAGFSLYVICQNLKTFPVLVYVTFSLLLYNSMKCVSMIRHVSKQNFLNKKSHCFAIKSEIFCINSDTIWFKIDISLPGKKLCRIGGKIFILIVDISHYKYKLCRDVKQTPYVCILWDLTALERFQTRKLEKLYQQVQKCQLIW